MKLFRLDIIAIITADTKDAAIAYALMIKEDLQTNSLIDAVPFLGLTEMAEVNQTSNHRAGEQGFIQ